VDFNTKFYLKNGLLYILCFITLLVGGIFNAQCDQKVSVHLMITTQSSGAQRLFDHPIF